MPDMIPAASIAAIALRHMRDAEGKLDSAVYSTEDRAAVKRSMAAATELLALIVPVDDRGADPSIRLMPVHLPELSPANA